MIREKPDMTDYEILKQDGCLALDRIKRQLANGDSKDAASSIKALIKKHTK